MTLRESPVDLEIPAARTPRQTRAGGGNLPGDGCTVCAHPDRVQIDEMLTRLPARQVARETGLSKDALSRHRHGGHRPLSSRSARSAPSASPTEPDDRPELEKLEEQAAILRQSLKDHGRSDTSRELRQVNERIATLKGQNDVRAVTLSDVQGLPEQLRRWAEALEPFPDAREAMMLATDEALLAAAGLSDG